LNKVTLIKTKVWDNDIGAGRKQNISCPLTPILKGGWGLLGEKSTCILRQIRK